MWFCRMHAQKLSEGAAIDEVVADGCQMMLRDSAAPQLLYEHDAKLYDKVSAWVREWVNKLTEALKKALADVAPNSATARALSQTADTMTELQKLWDEALVGAVENKAKSPAVNSEAVQYEVRDDFYTKFDAWDGVNPSITFTVGTTSDALKSIGMKDQEIKMRSGMILEKMHKHPEITRDIFRQIPDLIEEPIIVQFSDALDPKTGKPKYDSSITVMGEVYAEVKEDGKTTKRPVLVSLNLLPTNQKKTVILDYSLITSAYNKEALQRYLNENSILYIDPDKKRTNNWLSLNRLQLPVGENHYGSIRKLSYSGGVVKVQNSKNISPMQLALQNAGLVDEYGKTKQYSMRDPAQMAEDAVVSAEAAANMSNREILANALEAAAQTDLERRKLADYRKKIGLLNEQEQKLERLKDELFNLNFAIEWAKDKERIKEVEAEIKRTENRINTYDGQLLRLEAAKPLQDVLDREKAVLNKKLEEAKAWRKEWRERAATAKAA